MINSCFNPQCSKPLRYLREGRVFAFTVPVAAMKTGGRRTDRLEHYWLCGRCSVAMTLKQTCEGIYLVPRPFAGIRRGAATAAHNIMEGRKKHAL